MASEGGVMPTNGVLLSNEMSPQTIKPCCGPVRKYGRFHTLHRTSPDRFAKVCADTSYCLNPDIHAKRYNFLKFLCWELYVFPRDAAERDRACTG
ncbi:hypothetical protein LAZ67_14003425 [Cordylochernes scorpioides]|uniref:Uncharacterized protein n=1 Tax=Cordylochernes scorpioides TaxID=51811 RepID=A0ABY6L7M2_9ARAC|nr:hypothetical protein LAZ67_14003425 [Cordylochernes scorpioides]